MKMLKPSLLTYLCAVLALLVGALPSVGTAAPKNNMVLADPINASYPADCGGGPVQTGLCLLGSTAPLAVGSFTATEVRRDGQQGKQFPVTLNQRVAMPPGNYRLARDTGLDSLHELDFTVTVGQVNTFKTTTLRWSSKTASNLIVNLTAKPSSIAYLGTATLDWSSPQAKSCKASTDYGWSGDVSVSGSQAVTLANSTTYTLTCIGSDGVSVSQSVTVKVDPNQTACLFNWAERAYPTLFTPTGGATQNWSVYNYRFYPGTNSYLGVSVADNSVYYQGPDGQLQNEGPLSYWLPKAGCITPVTPSPRPIHSAGNPIKLQHFQARDGINGAGCVAESGNEGVQAYLPGNYVVSLNRSADNATPKCEHGGTVFNAMAGEGHSFVPGKVTPQDLPDFNSFRHPNQVSALTSVGPYHHPIDKLAFLPSWKSIRGINNPSSETNDALVLSGIGAVHFVFPFTLTQGQSQCGISLAKGGLPAHVLLTDCKFSGNTLTAFRVNSGSYYSFNSRHGKPALEGSYINNAILVSGVQFALK